MNDKDSFEEKSFLARMEPYFERNNLKAVVREAQNRLEEIPEDLSARIVICRVWLAEGRMDEVRDMLAEMEEILSGFSRLYECIGDLYRKKGLEKEARMFYRKGDALMPMPSFTLGANEEEEAFEDIADTVDAATENDEKHDETGENSEIPAGFETATLAELYVRQGHYHAAEDLLLKIKRQEPANDRVIRLLSDVRARIGQGMGDRTDEEIIEELSKWLNNLRRLRHNV
jgi:tetratricopeptide (TPR) repeat protein